MSTQKHKKKEYCVDLNPVLYQIYIGSAILYFDCPRSGLRIEPRCFPGKVYNVDYTLNIIQFITLENNDNDTNNLYCKRRCTFKELYDYPLLFPIDESDAKQYALKYDQKNDEEISSELMIDINILNQVFIYNGSNILDNIHHFKRKLAANKWQQFAHKTIINYYSKNDFFPDILPNIYTVSSTRSIGYGDGGRDTLIYPIYICDHLDVDKTHYKILKTELKKIGNENGDYRENEPIQNIIDPDLYSLRLDRNVFVDKYNQRFPQSSNYYRNGWRHDEFKQNVEKKWFIRGNYQWLPAVFKEEHRNNSLKPSKIKILSPIHNIGGDRKYKKLYLAIQNVFECMLPLFNKFEKFRNRKKDTFQVIVKSQRYAIQTNKGYSGMWHTEGLTENILFVGLYYFEWNKGLNGGNMKFRPKHLPSKQYENEEWSTFEIECGENAKYKAMVWDNQYFVHRVRMLKNINNDKKIRKKGFLAFFIIDPENELEKTTQNISSLKKEDYINTLYERVMVKYYKMPEFSYDLCTLIIEYASLGITLEEAKQRRKQVIDLKKYTKSKFGHIHFGNCGEVFYFPMGDAMKYHVSWDEWRKKYKIFDPHDLNTLTETQSSVH